MTKRKLLFITILLSAIALSSFVFGKNVLASEAKEENQEYFINLDKDTIAKGFTVSAFNDTLKLSLVPGILSSSTGVDVIELNEEHMLPWSLKKLSKIYQFEFRNKEAYDNHKPFYIQFAYEKETVNHKQVFFYDKNFQTWRPLPTRDFGEEKFVRSLIHLPFARIAVFEYPGVLNNGRASWYKYKGGNYAASPDFPKGSIIRVYNTENEKYVDVEINDFGPDRGLHPDRVVDLDAVAFAKIAPLWQGMAEVRIEPLKIVDAEGGILQIPSDGIGGEPDIGLAAGLVVSETGEEILWAKKSTTTLPLASLTKMVAVKVFFETRPDMTRVVEYKTQDEEYNYEWVENKWESAKLKVNEGDTMSIEDLVYSALVGSANNAIESLVRISGLARDDFIALMNRTVQNWGTKSTYFVEPTGLSPENVSSAADYVIITKKVLTHPIIQKASTMSRYEFETINTKEAHKLTNTNKLIQTNRYHINGSKTGYLNEAGYCLMLRARADNGDNVIVVTFGADTRDQSFQETEDLLQFGLIKLYD